MEASPRTGRHLRAIVIVSAMLGMEACSGHELPTAPIPSPAGQLRFSVQPKAAFAGSRFLQPISVSLVDGQGNPITSATGSISLTLKNLDGAVTALTGTTAVAVSGGVASFPDLAITKSGNSFFLIASFSGAVSATSEAFRIIGVPIVVDSSKMFLISDPLERANGRYVFVVRGVPPTIDSGVVVVGGQAGGFIRRVKSQSTLSDTIILETDGASLVDAVADGAFGDVATLNLQTGQMSGSSGQITWGTPFIRRSDVIIPLNAGPGFEWNDKLLVGSKEAGLMLDRLTVSIQPTLELDWKISGAAISTALVAVKTTLSADAKLTAGLRDALGTSRELPLAPPIIIPFTGLIPTPFLPLPVFGEVTLSLFVTGEVGATATGVLSASASGSITYRIGAAYRSNAWSAISESSRKFEAALSAKSELDLYASVGVKAVAGLTLYHTVGGEVTGRVGANWRNTLDFLHGTYANRCFVSTDLSVGLHLSILSHELAGFDKDIAADEYPITACDKAGIFRPAGRIDVSPGTASLLMGEQTQLIALVFDKAGLPVDRPIVWGSSDESVASVSATGVATAKRAGGLSTIRATADGASGTANIVVTSAIVDAVNVRNEPGVAKLLVGDITPLIAIASDAKGNTLTGKKASWSSTNPAIAAVSSLGVVTAKSLGQVNIAAVIDGAVGLTTVSVVSSLVVPVLKSITPSIVRVGSTNQTLHVDGSEFQNGLRVSVTDPGGAKVIASAGNVLNVTRTSFDLVWRLESHGPWAIQVMNVDGGVSLQKPFTVESSLSTAPYINSTLPIAPSAQSNSQTLRVFGGNFGSGLSAVVASPNGATSNLNGVTVQNITSSSFDLIVTLNNPGVWTVQIINSNNTLSSQYSFSVQGTSAVTPTVSLIASQTAIATGQSVVLTWSATNAAQCIGSWAAGNGQVPISGTATVTPTGAVTYTLRCSGSGTNPPTANASVTVTVGAAVATPTVITQSAANLTQTGFRFNGSINPNGVATSGYFEWSLSSATLSTFNSTSAVSIGSGTTSLPFQDNLINGLCGTTYYYRAVAQPTGGSLVRGSILSATTSACTVALPQVTLSANPTSIASGQNSTLTWSSTNAALCVGGWANNGAGGQVGTSGSVSVSPTATATYAIVCSGSGSNPPTANATASVMVTASATPTATSQAATNVTQTGFRMNGTINPNGVATSAYFESGTNATLSGFNASSPANLGTTAQPISSDLTGLVCGTTTYYRAVAQPAGGSLVRGIILSETTSACTVAPPQVTLSANPTSISAGQSTTLTWSSTNAALCVAGWANNGAGGQVATSGSVSVSPTATATYAIVCSGSGSNPPTANAITTVTVTAATPLPDLRVLNGTVSPASVSGGGSVNASWSITNQGTGAAGASTTEVRITASSTSAAGSNLATVSTASLAAGGSVAQSRTLTAPTTAGTYHVWVVADNYNAAGQSTSATTNDIVRIGSFVVTAAGPAIPAVPSNTTPGVVTAPGPTQPSNTVTVSWGAVSGATYYELGVTDVATGGLVVNQQPTGTSYTATLTAGKEYRWNVAACNSAGCSSYTTRLYFQTPAAGPAVPAVPSNTTPGAVTAPGPTQASNTVTVSWGAVSGATYYELGVTDVATGGLVVNQQPTGTSYTASLTAGKQYRWNVAACNSAGCSSYSTRLYFQTPTAVTIPPTPGATSPGSTTAPGPTLASRTVTLSWSTATGASYYDLGVTDIATGSLVVNQQPNGSSYTATLTAGKQYRWNVAACNSAGCSSYTARLYFKTP